MSYVDSLPFHRRVTFFVNGWLNACGWPSYDCKDCVGAGLQHGCYCAYHGAVAPCDPEPRLIQQIARWLHRRLFPGYDRYKNDDRDL